MDRTNSTPTTAINPTLLIIPFQVNIWFGLFIFITGNISTIGNFIVFTSRLFRARAYSLYLIAESICSLIYFNYVLVTRMIQKGYQFPIINRYDPICKIRQFLSIYTHQVAFTLFALATIDRILSTHRSIVYRQWSNRRTLVYKLIPAVVIIWFVCVSHRLVLYSNISGSCGPQLGIYEKFDSYFEVIMSGMVPPILLILLGCLLLRNVRDVARRRIAPADGTLTTSQSNNAKFLYIQQIDAQIATTLLLQSFVAIPSFIPFGFQNLYTSITRSWYKSPLQLAYEDIIIEIIRLLSYIFYSTSFYISAWSSHGFRKQVWDSLGFGRKKQIVNQTNTFT
ncbi:hypothetical protein I4U23_020358 [Adineta vaga]|nr:hypothetical protein I4U23_020358 [Adineta vaga]